MGFVEKIVFWIIPLVVFVLLTLYFFNPEDSLFTSIKLLVQDIQKVGGPEITFGKEAVTPSIPSIPSDHQKAIDSLRKSIAVMEGKKNCIERYPSLPFLGEAGTSLRFEEVEGSYSLVIRAGAAGKQEVAAYPLFKGFTPCVIAGGEAAANFYYNFLELHFETTERSDILDEESTDPAVVPITTLREPYYNNVWYLQIKGKSGKNVIAYDYKKVYQEDVGVQDGGLLFTPGNGHICFFPTANYWFGKKSSGIGLDEDLFTEGAENSITAATKAGQLSLCREDKDGELEV